VLVQAPNQDLAKAFGLNGAQGAVVSQVQSGSAAERAGLMSGDVILKVDGHPGRGLRRLAAVIAGHAPGSKVDLEIWRDRRSLHVTSQHWLADEEESDADDSTAGAAEPRTACLSVHPLTAEERQESGLRSGLVVEEASGAARHAGNRAQGDVITGSTAGR